MIVAQPATAAFTTFLEVSARAREFGPRRIGIVLADDNVSLTAASLAMLQGIADPVLIGDPGLIRSRAESLGLTDLIAAAEFVYAPHDPSAAAHRAVQLVRDGAIDILMKGRLRTDELLHPVLDRAHGLRAGRLLSDVAIAELSSPAGPRLVALSDGGLNVAPTLEQKREIILNAIDVLRCVGVLYPKVALLSALEIVYDALPSTMEARALTELAATGAFGEADVYGPLALDNALFEWAAHAKGITHPVAGRADCLIVPSIEAGNLLAKAVHFLAHAPLAHVVAGAAVPILIPSRVESVQDKVNSIALGVLYGTR